MTVDSERTMEGKHRRFAGLAAALAVVLIPAGVLLAGRSGVANVIGLVCLAYGIGIAVAAPFIYAGRNPLVRNGRDGQG